MVILPGQGSLRCPNAIGGGGGKIDQSELLCKASSSNLLAQNGQNVDVYASHRTEN